MKTVRDLNVKNKRVLVRCDFNVPLNPEGDILDDFKIRQTLPTINYLVKNRSRIILMSHLDDPGGRVVERLRLGWVQKRLEKYLGRTVLKTIDCVGPEVRNLVGKMGPGQIVLLENLRFHPEEEKGDLRFARKLAGLADIFINDAFAVCHRRHASLLASKFLPSAAGLLLEKELKALTGLSKCFQKPLIVILGGRSRGLETKLTLLKKFLRKADFILLGNLVTEDIKMSGQSLVLSKKLVFPSDSVDGFDIGPGTLRAFKKKIALAKTIFWSGPLGKTEEKKYVKGSKEVAKAIIKSGAFSVGGGGDTIYFLKRARLRDKFSYVSTGGDALLVFLSGEKLPGLEMLK